MKAYIIILGVFGVFLQIGYAQVENPYKSTTEKKETFVNDRFFRGSEKDVQQGGTFYYNNSGQQVGRSEQQGDTKRFYDSSGAYTGYTRSDFSRDQYYDSTGKYTGYSVQEGDIIRHYSSGGEYLGYTQQQDGIKLQFDGRSGIQGQSVELQSGSGETNANAVRSLLENR
ncbi:MAG: hypothetical protein AB1454_06970 [Candidatus Auribacterota bacterium]